MKEAKAKMFLAGFVLMIISMTLLLGTTMNSASKIKIISESGRIVSFSGIDHLVGMILVTIFVLVLGIAFVIIGGLRQE